MNNSRRCSSSKKYRASQLPLHKGCEEAPFNVVKSTVNLQLMCWSTVVGIIKFVVFFPWSLMQLFRKTHLTYEEGGPLDVENKPDTTEEMAKELVYRLYGMKAMEVKKMNGYDDENYYVQVSPEHINPYLTELNRDGYTLKIMNAVDSKDKNFVNGMNQVITHVRSKGIYVPEPVPNVLGELWSVEEIPMKKYPPPSEEKKLAGGCKQIEFHAGYFRVPVDKSFRRVWSPSTLQTEPLMDKCVIRLFTFLPGMTVHTIPSKFANQISYQWGKLLAQLHNSLEEFHTPLLEHRRTPWSLLNVRKLNSLLHIIQNPNHMHVTLGVLKAFHRIYSKLRELPKAVIHGDFNEQNVIALEKPPEGCAKNPNYVVYGVLDFGDVQMAPIVCDVAIMMAYTVLNNCDSVIPTSASGHALAGYLSLRRLSNEELSMLRALTAGRIIQSLILAANAYRQDPTNHYILSTTRKGWPCLEQMWRMPATTLHEHWKFIISKYSTIDVKTLIFDMDTDLLYV